MGVCGSITRNDRMNALDYFAKTGTAYHLNQFGATLGGPILKNKIFVFADAQGDTHLAVCAADAELDCADRVRAHRRLQRTAQSGLTPRVEVPLRSISRGGTATSTVGGTANAGANPRYLTCNGVQNVICAAQLNAVAKNVLALFPLPNSANVHQAFNNYTAPATATTSNTTQVDVRLDYNFSPKDQMFGRYSYSNNPVNYAPLLGALDGGGFGSSGQNSNDGKSGVFSETHFFSPTLSNEFRVGYNYLHASDLGPNAANSGFASSLGLGGIPVGQNLGGSPGD